MKKPLEMSSRLLQTSVELDELLAEVSALRDAVLIAEAMKVKRDAKSRRTPAKPATEVRA